MGCPSLLRELELYGLQLVTIALRRDIYMRAVAYCRWRNMGLSDLIEEALREFLKEGGVTH